MRLILNVRSLRAWLTIFGLATGPLLAGLASSASAQQPLPTSPTAPVTATAAAPDPSPPALTILADSSLRDVLPRIVQTWADGQEGNPRIALTFANAATILATIKASRPVDVILMADANDIKALTTAGWLGADTPATVARNSLVLYGRKVLLKDDDLAWYDLIGGEWKKVALPDPEQCVSGRLARRALEQHDLFDESHRSLFTKALTERAAAQIAQREQADAVFLYKTDVTACAVPGFEVFPLASADAPPIFYTAAITRSALNPILAQSFVAACSSPAARALWVQAGFESN